MGEKFDAQVYDIVIHVLRYLGWIVLLVALKTIYNAFRAETRASKSHGDDVRDCRERTRQALLVPTLARIVVIAHDAVSWSRFASPQELEDRVRGELSVRVAAFGSPLSELEKHGGSLRDADLVHDHLVASRKGEGWAMAAFTPCWLVLLWWAYYGKGAPATLPIAVAVLGAAALGWFFAEVWRATAEENAFSRLKKEIDRLHVGG